MSEEKKEKNLDIAASKESNETEKKGDSAVETNESSTINEQNNDMKKENNSIEKNDNVVTKENNSLEKKQEKKFNFKNVFDNIKRSFTNKQFRSGAYSSVLTVLVIAIVVVVNLVFGKLDLSTDLSSGSYFTLSKTTKKILKQVDSDITIYYMVQDGSEQDYISNALKQ